LHAYHPIQTDAGSFVALATKGEAGLAARPEFGMFGDLESAASKCSQLNRDVLNLAPNVVLEIVTSAIRLSKIELAAPNN
jgi:hypothetical protein